MLPVALIALVGALWIALGFIAYAIFAALAGALGAPGAAAATAAILLVVAGLGGLFVRARLAAARRNAMIASLATSGVANVALGLLTKKPLVTLGVAGALAAFFFARGGDRN